MQEFVENRYVAQFTGRIISKIIEFQIYIIFLRNEEWNSLAMDFVCLIFKQLLISLDTQENKKLSENKSYEDERISVDP